MSVSDDNLSASNRAKQARGEQKAAEAEKRRKTAADALSKLPDAARACLLGDTGFSIVGLSLKLLDTGDWRLTITALESDQRMVAFTRLSTPAELWTRLAKVCESAEWRESDY